MQLKNIMNPIDLLNQLNVPCNLGAIDWHVDAGHAAIYPPATDEMIHWAETRMQQKIPQEYCSILGVTNGLFFSALTLFGIPILFKSNLINRRELQPLDITEANLEWRYEDGKHSNAEWLAIGCLEEYDSNTYLFMDAAGDVYQILGENCRTVSLGDIFCELANA